MKQVDYKKLQNDFSQDGYVYIPQFLDPQETNDVRLHMEKFISEKVPTMPQEHVFYEDQKNLSTLKQLQALFTYDNFFQKIMFGGQFQQLAEKLLNTEVVGKNMQYFNKPAGIGKPTPPHQDGYYFMLEPNEAITIWLGLDHVDASNGCVRYVKGSYLKGMRPHSRTKTLGFSQGISDYNEADVQQEVWYNTGPGDVLAHHSLTVHRADANMSSDRGRRAIGFIYYSASAKENTIKKSKYQQQLKDDLLKNKL